VTPVFQGPDLHVVLEVAGNKAIEEASRINDERVLNVSVQELVDEILSRHDMDAPVLYPDRWEVTETGSGSGVELHVPFTGTPGLFGNQPNFYTAQYPPGEVAGDEIVVRLGAADSGVLARANQWLQLAQQYLDAVAHDLEIWRRELREQIQGWVNKRRQQAETHREGLRNLGIPIRRRDDAPRTFTLPAIERRDSPARSTSRAAQAPAEPEPALSDAYYEHILFVIRAAGHAMERAPETYNAWGEEDRRQVLILMLNTHYAGKVLAEAFNGDGKTDILIREDDRNVFIGECKFYGGPKTVIDTLAQIFGYATWRDVRLAMIFFVDRVSFTDAVEKIRETVEASEQFRRWLPLSDEHESEFRAQMVWPGDEQRLVTMHVSAFLTPRRAQELVEYRAGGRGAGA
jgi:hypothetical protein